MNAEELMPKQFVHKDAEKRIYKLWEELKIFSGTIDPKKKPFCVVIPPPNVTGILHMGHVLDNIPQDVMTRWHRMRGFAAVWIPGTDHAGIATQNVVKKALEKEGINYKDLGREKFIEKVWEWKQKSGNIIIEQLKRLGCSCDWARERFTMDEGMVRAVLTAFVEYYKRGLVYRGKRMINWCTVCETALSDDEVEHATHNSHLWHFRYPILDSNNKPTNEYVVVATTRPETMLGDTGVAVHPEDERYKHLVGKKVLLPIQNRAIPIIADDFVDLKFGSGAVKLTPAHDPNDFVVGNKHKLAFEIVIGENGKMTAAASPAYAGLDRNKARKNVVAELEKLGLVEKIDKHSHAVGECYRCKSIIEPLISDQWFVKMRPLAEKATAAVKDGRTKIVPESEKNDFFDWMNRIEDWCISRQLWWGHRIPVYYCGDCKHVVASVEAPEKCENCSSANLTQDEDVLDTWFSSQLWPFGVLGWPEKTPELEFWYPNNWLMSGRDILFFWDTRMMMSGLELMGEVPFHTLVLHGLVRDSQGRKLSKSLGNSPDPLDLFDQYGTDAVRTAIALNYPLGRQDTRLGDETFREGQALIIKLWNASRLVISNLTTGGLTLNIKTAIAGNIEDAWILSRLSETIELHDAYLSKNDLVHASETVRNFFWNEFCDWFLEIVKPRLWESGDKKQTALNTALICLRTLLKLFHPYAPFVTEDLWQVLQKNGIKDSAEVGDETALASATWPDAAAFPRHLETEQKMGVMMTIVRGIRDVRHHLNIPPKADLRVKLEFFNANDAVTFDTLKLIAEQLGYVKEFEVHSGSSIPTGYVPFKFAGGVGYVSLPGSFNAKEVLAKLDGKIQKLEKELGGIEKNLANPNFVANAPAQLVEETKGKAKEAGDAISKLNAFRDSLKA